MIKGACLCRAVKYHITGAMRSSIACHYTQCRKTSGHYWSATSVVDANLILDDDRGLRWYASSKTAQRGFYCNCGSSLFWRLANEGRTSIATGTLDGQTGLREELHIFVDNKGDYYDLPKNVQQRKQ